MTSRFRDVPRDLLLLQLSHLDDSEAEKLCSVDDSVRAGCDSPEYYQQRFERNFSTDKEWLKACFLKDRQYSDHAPADIPASAYDYYNALREARMLTNTGNRDKMLYIDIYSEKWLKMNSDKSQLPAGYFFNIISYGIPFACRYNFDNYLQQVITIILAVVKSGNSVTSRGNTEGSNFSSLLGLIAKKAISTRRLNLLQLLCDRLNMDGSRAMLEGRGGDLSPEDGPAMNLSPEDVSSDLQKEEYDKIRRLVNNNIDNAIVIGQYSFDQAMYDYLNGPTFPARSERELDYMRKSLANYYGTMTEPFPNEKKIYKYDSVALVKRLPITDPMAMFMQATKLHATSILAYFTTLPQFYHVAVMPIKKGRDLPLILGLVTILSIEQLEYFFSAKIIDYIMEIDWPALWEELRETMIDGSPATAWMEQLPNTAFYTNYRTIVRHYLPTVKVDKVIETIMILLERSFASYYFPTEMILQEYLRVDMLTDRGGCLQSLREGEGACIRISDITYRDYLAYIFANLFIAPVDFKLERVPIGQKKEDFYLTTYGYRYIIKLEEIVTKAYLYFLYIKYYYLVGEIPVRPLRITTSVRAYTVNTDSNQGNIMLIDVINGYERTTVYQFEDIPPTKSGTLIQTFIQDKDWLKQQLP